MLKNLLSILFLMLMTAGLFAQSIPSGTGRVEALGNNPFFLDAATDINRNPAWAGMYRNYIFGDLGRATMNGSDFYLDNQYAGINFGIGKQMTLGGVFNKDESMWSSFNDANSTHKPSDLGISAPIIPLKILFSYASKTMSIGVAPYLAMWSQDNISTIPDTTREWKNSSNTLGGTAGIVYKMKGTNWFELAVDVKLNKFKQDYTLSAPSSETITESQGGLQLQAFARGWFLISKPSKINFIPYAGFSMFNWNPNVTTTPTATTTPQPNLKNMTINGGFGLNLPVLDDGLLAGGLSVAYTQYHEVPNDTTRGEVKKTYFTLPQFNIGLEWTFTDWLTARFGYMRSVINTKNDSLTTGRLLYETSSSYSGVSNPDQTVSTGLGLEFGRFSFDGTIGEKFYQRAPWVISGHATDLFGVISVSYNFNKK